MSCGGGQPILLFMNRLPCALAQVRLDERGQTMTEYSVALTVITLAALTALGLLTGSVIDALNRVAGYFA
jgi:Flp pilus assembly pilin Flp